MDKLCEILTKLKVLNCTGIKISFEDEGAQLNEMITMNALTKKYSLDLAIKIGGCEAKNDIINCNILDCNHIVAPMVETNYALSKFIDCVKLYTSNKEIGFNLETIESFNNLSQLYEQFQDIDFITFGRVDFIKSLGKDRDFVNSDEMFDTVKKVFTLAKRKNIKCYLGGAISKDSKKFIKNLIDLNLIDKFETRYAIFSVDNLDINKFNEIIYNANLFELEWLKFISNRYQKYADKDSQRIIMIKERIKKNKI